MKLKFHKKLYTKKAITKSARAFHDAASVKITTMDDYHVVDINGYDKESTCLAAKEFCNYVIFAMKN